MTESKPLIHRLSHKDVENMTAFCEVDGLVSIRKSGTGFQCAVKKAASHKTWARQNPEKARANRAQRSDHALFNRDYAKLTADCQVCGSVDLLMYGAGYACGNRARELRQVQQDEQAGGRCRECTIIDGPAKAPRLRSDGSCPRCEDPSLSDLSGLLRTQEHTFRHAGRERVPEGFHVAYDSLDEYAMAPNESAVPGWKTLGSDRPWNEA